MLLKIESDTFFHFSYILMSFLCPYWNARGLLLAGKEYFLFLVIPFLIFFDSFNNLIVKKPNIIFSCLLIYKTRTIGKIFLDLSERYKCRCLLVLWSGVIMYFFSLCQGSTFDISCAKVSWHQLSSIQLYINL